MCAAPPKPPKPTPPEPVEAPKLELGGSDDGSQRLKKRRGRNQLRTRNVPGLTIQSSGSGLNV